MSEYTKEQEAEALERAAQYSDMDSRPYWRIVLAMAKRTAEAEKERDALKARVAELEAAHQGLADVLKEERRKAAPPPVAVTREMVEMMLADAETRAVYGRGDVPLNPAARLVVALRKMLE